MADHTAQAGVAALEPLLAAARAQLDADATSLSGALRAMPANAPDSVTRDVFLRIVAARRHAYAWFVTIRNLDTDDPVKAEALAALSTLAAALGSWYRALRTTDSATGQRENQQARERFAAAARILDRIDETLGGRP